MQHTRVLRRVSAPSTPPGLAPDDGAREWVPRPEPTAPSEQAPAPGVDRWGPVGGPGPATPEPDLAPGPIDEPTPTPSPEPESTGDLAPAPESGRRTVSSLAEVVDGGYGVGSAAPVHDGAMPLGHPVKGVRAEHRFWAPGARWYDQVTPDVWFRDEAAARGAGFHPEQG